MRTKSIIFYTALIVFCIGCEKTENKDTLGLVNPIYFNSFESESDTIGWKGSVILVEDAPILGGSRSLFVSGGCVVPHVYFNIGTLPADCNLLLKCWGKNLSNGGEIYLGASGPFLGSSIFVSEKEWKAYQSQDTMFCPANSRLGLRLDAGGIYFSSMLVDMIEVIKVD